MLNDELLNKMEKTMNNGEIILYQPDSSIRLEVRMEEETVWLTQAQMAMLFACSQDNIGLQPVVFLKPDVSSAASFEWKTCPVCKNRKQQQ